MTRRFHQQAALLCMLVSVSLVGLLGCNQQEAKDLLEKSEETIEDAAKSVGDEAENLVEEGKEMAAELSEQAQAYLNPIKAKFGDLDSLKESPEKLRDALSDMIKSMEGKAANIDLPESIADALASTKEKMVALVSYLEGEYEQSEVSKKLKEIMESAKSAFGL